MQELMQKGLKELQGLKVGLSCDGGWWRAEGELKSWERTLGIGRAQRVKSRAERIRADMSCRDKRSSVSSSSWID